MVDLVIGCNFCSKYDFSNASAKVTEDGATIELAICNTRFQKEKQFNYCPVCGRNLNT